MIGKFKIIVPSFNCVDYIRKSLHSIEIQTYRNYEVCVIDDASTIHEQQDIILEFCQRNKWKYQFHDKNYGALYGLVHAIQEMACKDDDVIVILDGDDWLYDEHVLEKVHQIYKDKDVYLTWGQCEVYPAGKTPMKYAQPIPDLVITQQLYREIPFVFWHLVTFKYFLWRQIKDEDLRDTDGEYFRVLKDKATLFPMFEMAAHKIQFVSDTLYIYNIENPLNDYIINQSEYARVNEILKKRPRYHPLFK